MNIGSTIAINLSRLKEYGASIFGLGLVTKGAAEGAQYIHKAEIAKARHREIRRTECRKEVKELKSQKLDATQEQEEIDSISTMFTLSALDDNQSVDNITQDLTMAECIAQDHQAVIIVGPNPKVINNIPGFPSNYKGFLLAVQSPDGNARVVNNPLNIALPVPGPINSPGSSRPIPPNSSAFGSINKSFFDQHYIYSSTTYNPKTNKVSTERVKAGDLFKGKKVFFQGEEVVITRQGTVERVQNTNVNIQGTNEDIQGTSEGIQGVNPNPTPVFTRFEGRCATPTAVGIIFLQLLVIFAFSMPLLEFLQNLIRQRFFEDKKTSKTEKEITFNKKDEKIKPDKSGQKD